MQPKTTYASYLLRLWQMQNDGQGTWVAWLQSPTTGEQHWFPSVEALLCFLQSEFGADAPPDPGAPSAGPADDHAHPAGRS